MAGLTIRVYTYNPATRETREVSEREWSFDSMPDGSPIDTRWPLCMCRRCKGEGTPGELRRQRA